MRSAPVFALSSDCTEGRACVGFLVESVIFGVSVLRKVVDFRAESRV